MTDLACALTRLGWKIEVICGQPTLNLESENPRVPVELEYEGVRVRRVSALGSHRRTLWSRLLFGVSFVMTSVMAVFRSRKQFDGLLVTTNPPFLALAGVICSQFLGLPYVLIIHDLYPDIPIRLGLFSERSLIASIWHRMTRLMLNRAAACVAIGRDMEEIVAARVDPSRRQIVCVIPNWFNAPHTEERQSGVHFRAKYGLDESLLVQYSGRMGQTHNLEALIDAAEILRGRQIIFQLIGDGAKKVALQRLARDKQLANVQFLPYRAMEDLQDALSAADIAVVCLDSRFTGLSVPSKSYGVMASGKPILALLDLKSEIAQTISEVGCGVVLPEATGYQIAKSIEELADQPELRKRMGQKGREAFEARFTLEIAAVRYSELCERVFGKGGEHATARDAR